MLQNLKFENGRYYSINKQQNAQLTNIFKVNNLKPTLNQHLFDLHKGVDSSMYGFHGSPLQNWHSILHNGLAEYYNERSVLGHGSYLSGFLSLSLSYSSHKISGLFANTRLPENLLCVAMCETINYPNVIKGKINDVLINK